MAYELTSSGAGRNTVYGISYRDRGGAGLELADVSCNCAFVGKMVELFNLCELPPDRLKRVVIELIP